MPKQNLLVTTDLLDRSNTRRLARYSKVLISSKIRENELPEVLPSVDALMIFSWPTFLTDENLARMPRLKFIQSILAGVNHIPFSKLDRKIVVASNAGAYSGPVAEFACGLLLSAAKRITEHHTTIREGRGVLVRHGDAAQGIYILEGKTLGILGYGGIGQAVAKVARAMGMRVLAYGRRSRGTPGVTLLRDRKGLGRILGESDAIILALPLTKETTRIINGDSLSAMKDEMVLVNVARGELVDEDALYKHLREHPGFRYATDVWWYKEGKESLTTNHDFASLPNFIGAPHVSGPSGLATGLPVKVAVENTLRFLTKRPVKNTVNRTDYTG
jgi:phosphoglycerate dehydrogenase-like enzyme